MDRAVFKCNICSSEEGFEYNDYPEFIRVTSDCRPWRIGGRLGVCKKCAIPQKIVTPKLLEETDEIYKYYSLYYQADGEEQLKAKDTVNGEPSCARSLLILDKFIEKMKIDTEGRWLDIGCGKGDFLCNISNRLPRWTLSGHEIHIYDEDRLKLETLSMMKGIFEGDLDNLKGEYDVISLLHVLEHVLDPISFMKKIRKVVKSNTKLLINVPNLATNPYDLLVADHLTHFSRESLEKLLNFAGFDVEVDYSHWIHNELVMVAIPCDKKNISWNDFSKMQNFVRKRLDWFKFLIEDLKINYKDKKLGLFGTANAAIWFLKQLGEENISFFVDEDPQRIGKELYGKMVYSLHDIPKNSTLVLSFFPATAKKIAKRLESKIEDLEFYIPRDID